VADLPHYLKNTHFTALWDNVGELVPEGTFCHLLDFLKQNEDNTNKYIHITIGTTTLGPE